MRAALALFVSLTCLTGLAHADIKDVKAGKVSIDLPTKWSFDVKDEVLRAVSPDNNVAFVVLVVDTPDVKAALTRLEGELYSSVKGLKWVDKVKKLKINKLPASWVEGAGVSGRAAQLDVLVVVAGPTPAKKGVIMMAVVEHDKLVANQKAIQGIFKTLKPTK
jgi:hypothetical protein